MNPNPSRMPLIDTLKALASQLIVLHHLSAYGPLSDAMGDMLPSLMEWFYDYGRMAVQVFLVIGGFLAARSLAPQGRAVFAEPVSLVWRRYLRLATPFVAAILFAIICSAVARAWMDDEAIPDKATLGQFLAHVLLLHSLLDFDALSAGVWYVAIDFQLFALFAVTLWLARSLGGRSQFNPAPFLVAALAMLSLFHFNRDESWDNWGLYFFGSYALGATAFWASDRQRSSAWLGAIWSIGLAALLVDFRLRIAIALAVALLLGFSRRSGLLEKWPEVRPIEFLGRISYSVFLVHFPIYLVVSALYDYSESESASVAIAAMLAAWATSIAAGYAFHQLVESRAPSYWPSLILRQGLRLVPRTWR